MNKKENSKTAPGGKQRAPKSNKEGLTKYNPSQQDPIQLVKSIVVVGVFLYPVFLAWVKAGIREIYIFPYQPKLRLSYCSLTHAQLSLKNDDS